MSDSNGKPSFILPLLSVLKLSADSGDFLMGESKSIGTGRMYGGQLLAQGLLAAEHGASGRNVHSLHANFLRVGHEASPVCYHTENELDGGTFTICNIRAAQGSQNILTMTASLKKAESGLEYQATADEVPPPEECWEPVRGAGSEDDFHNRSRGPCGSFLLRGLPSTNDANNRSGYWIKTCRAMPSSEQLHRAAIAYISDWGILRSSLVPHGKEGVGKSEMVIASLNHSIWFHRAARIDEWLLFCIKPCSTENGLGLSQGTMTNREGELVATVIQQGLIRPRVDTSASTKH